MPRGSHAAFPPRGGAIISGVRIRRAAAGLAVVAVVGLATSVQALGVDQGSCGIYWQEQGDEADVEEIVAALNAWADAISGGT